MEVTWTILKLIQWTTQYFAGKGMAQPRADAEVLLAHVLGMERIQLYLKYDQPLQAAELTAYRDAIRRRAGQEPVQYITGHQEFWSLDLEVTPAVLIPRPETEILVEQALDLLGKNHSEPPLILDVGTGSGAIAIALAHAVPSLQVMATDLSPAALLVARRNAVRHRVVERIAFVAMDLFSSFSSKQAGFDLIVSNPPYIANQEMAALAPEIVGSEPHIALRGGPQGLAVICRLLKDAWRWLKPEGSLLVEIGFGQVPLLARELASNGRYQEVAFIDDHARIPRVLRVRRGTL